MIAFDKLVQNINEYEKSYKLIGFHFNSQKFLNYAKIRKNFQLEYESSRATCNKLCEEFAEKKDQNFDLKPSISKINTQNKKTKQLKHKLECFVKKIDGGLKKLPNLPIDKNLDNLEIATNETFCSKEEFFEFLKGISSKISFFNDLTQNFCKSNQNVIIELESLPDYICCKDGLIILYDENSFENEINSIINYLKLNAKKLVKCKIQNMPKTSSLEFKAEFKEKNFTKIEIVGDYLTREFKIKYRDKKIDMTKFPYQIIIK